MDPVDIRELAERAKADAAATRVLKAGPGEELDSLLDEVGKVPTKADPAESLAEEIKGMVERSDEEAKVSKEAAVERRRLVKIAKLLAALDVVSEVR